MFLLPIYESKSSIHPNGEKCNPFWGNFLPCAPRQSPSLPVCRSGRRQGAHHIAPLSCHSLPVYQSGRRPGNTARPAAVCPAVSPSRGFSSRGVPASQCPRPGTFRPGVSPPRGFSSRGVPVPRARLSPTHRVESREPGFGSRTLLPKAAATQRALCPPRSGTRLPAACTRLRALPAAMHFPALGCLSAALSAARIPPHDAA